MGEERERLGFKFTYLTTDNHVIAIDFSTTVGTLQGTSFEWNGLLFPVVAVSVSDSQQHHQFGF